MAASKRNSPRLLTALIEWLSDGLVFDKPSEKKLLSKFGQTARKQPLEEFRG
jgi:hypothetical protein